MVGGAPLLSADHRGLDAGLWMKKPKQVGVDSTR